MHFATHHNRNIVLTALFVCATALCSIAQTTAQFTVPDRSKETMCYIPTNNTRIDFRNQSTCAGDCMYVWNFGDNSDQMIKNDLTTASYVYTADGQFQVELYAVNTATIHDSIKNSQISHISLEDTAETIVSIAVTFRNSINNWQTSTLHIPATDFSSYQYPRRITIFSPEVKGENFTYFIQNNENENRTEPLESFAYVFEVNSEAFQPFDVNMWTYYWEIYQSDVQGNPTRLLKTEQTDSLRMYYTFSEENFSPGYVVHLKIALDSSKFDYQGDIDYYRLAGCVATQSQTVQVTDYFFDEATRRDENPLDRTARIPNIFTPGGGDENETFYFDTNGADVFSIQIFNSWGVLVYSEKGIRIQWDGKNSSGTECPSGVYYYVIQSNESDERHERGGF
ncbi:MAG: gliding motility-associated C-terminal domain-containing protein, partial [Bacteroidales bacterium]|nr:gliding motility-associated C-terminal domain-containing protein [Bacteroidales bacterium]